MVSRRLAVAIVVAAALTACGGDGAPSSTFAPGAAPYSSGTIAVDGVTSVHEPAGYDSGALFFAPAAGLTASTGQLAINGSRAANTDSLAFDSADELLAISNDYLTGVQTIFLFAKGSLGSTVPAWTSPSEGLVLGWIRRLAVGSGDQLVYIEDYGFSTPYTSSSIHVLQRSAGSFTAVRTIGGPATGLSGASGPAVTCDAIDAGGTIYAGTAENVLVFSATQNGDGAPARQIAIPGGASALAVAKDGSLAVISGASILVFPAGANTAGRTIAGNTTTLTHPGALAFDAKGGLYVVDSGTIAYFSATANGNVAPIRTIPVANGALNAVAVAP
jgi:hypothetical protein